MLARVLKYLCFFLIIFGIFVGPWPVDNTHYSQTQYAKKSFAEIKTLTPDHRESLLSAGTAKAEIVPAIDAPLAGYSARKPKTHNGAQHKIYAKALTLSNSHQTITVLNAEILLPLEKLINAVLINTKLKRHEVYFTSTHTHSGLGGYANGLIEEASLGSFSQSQFDNIVKACSAAILESRNNLQPAKIRYRRLNLSRDVANEFIYNQLDENSTGHRTIHTLEVLKTEKSQTESEHRISSLITFSAHPTYLGRLNHAISGDYPHPLMKTLEENLGGTVLFASGAVGGMLPPTIGRENEKNVANQTRQLNLLGKRLGRIITEHLNKTLSVKNEADMDVNWSTDSTSIDSMINTLHLPYPNYLINQDLRLSPFLVNALFHGNKSYIHTLRIGKLFLLAYPADYSGELADQLEQWGNSQDIFAWSISFNGEYLGYLMPSKLYSLDHYTTRDVNFYGRWTGDYFHHSSKQIIQALR